MPTDTTSTISCSLWTSIGSDGIAGKTHALGGDDQHDPLYLPMGDLDMLAVLAYYIGNPNWVTDTFGPELSKASIDIQPHQLRRLGKPIKDDGVLDHVGSWFSPRTHTGCWLNLLDLLTLVAATADEVGFRTLMNQIPGGQNEVLRFLKEDWGAEFIGLDDVAFTEGEDRLHDRAESGIVGDVFALWSKLVRNLLAPGSSRNPVARAITQGLRGSTEAEGAHSLLRTKSAPINQEAKIERRLHLFGLLPRRFREPLQSATLQLYVRSIRRHSNEFMGISASSLKQCEGQFFHELLMVPGHFGEVLVIGSFTYNKRANADARQLQRRSEKNVKAIIDDHSLSV